jgi:signal transduction histidine kinase
MIRGSIVKVKSLDVLFCLLAALAGAAGSAVFLRPRFLRREAALRHEREEDCRKLEEHRRRWNELEQARSRFFANISYELRTPLALLLAPLEALLHHPPSAPEPGLRDRLQTMHHHGMRLLNLLNDLLDLVRLESGKMEVRRKPVLPSAVALGLVNSVRKPAKEKGISLETQVDDAEERLLLDEDKLEKIVLNLLFNALKSTPAGGRIAVRIHRQDQALVLQVEDSGKAIPEDQLPHVFQELYQKGESASFPFSSTNMGLTLVKAWVEVQGGTVTVQSTPDRGTTFTVRLPCATAIPNDPKVGGLSGVQVFKRDRSRSRDGSPCAPGSGEETPAIPASPRQDRRLAGQVLPEWPSPERTGEDEPIHDHPPTRREGEASLMPGDTGNIDAAASDRFPMALIADDEPDMMRFLKSHLADRFVLVEATDGAQAVEKARALLPAIILCDLMMPKKDGMQVCRELRGCPATQSIPVVLLTARADEETRLAALAAGASDFLTKPFSTSELHARLKNLVATHQLQIHLARQNQVLEATLKQLKETETQLVQSEKMASLGRMSAGIIHEINNPLNYAKTGLYTLGSKTPLLPAEERSDFAEIVRDIEEGINRVNHIVSDLRAFTHPDTDQCEEVPVNEVVSAAVRLLSNEWKEGHLHLEQDTPSAVKIWGNRNRLIQVVINLLQNALDALRQKEFPASNPTVWIRCQREAGQSRLIIRDNGQGIRPEHLDKIFEPFFTTKEVGAGMGLGLSICYRIVAEHRGRIAVQSEWGDHTEFTLDFPARPPATGERKTTGKEPR